MDLAPGRRSFAPLTVAVALVATFACGCATPPDAQGVGGGEASAVGAVPSHADPSHADMPPERDGQPTASDLAFLEGAWRQEGLDAVTGWEVWRRTERGFVGEAWQASRGISRQVERLDLELTLDGWVLTPTLFDEFERPNESDPFPLTAWGRGWARFENPDHRTPHTIAYRRTAPDRLEAWLVSAGPHGEPRTTAFRFVSLEE